MASCPNRQQLGPQQARQKRPQPTRWGRGKDHSSQAAQPTRPQPTRPQPTRPQPTRPSSQGPQPSRPTAHKAHSPQGPQPTRPTAHKAHSPQGPQPTRPTAHKATAHKAKLTRPTAHKAHSPQGPQPTRPTAHKAHSPIRQPGTTKAEPRGALPAPQVANAPPREGVLHAVRPLLVQRLPVPRSCLQRAGQAARGARGGPRWGPEQRQAGACRRGWRRGGRVGSATAGKDEPQPRLPLAHHVRCLLIYCHPPRLFDELDT
jgi:hypothetical protein